jgi:heme-degrading monooxygenase HmoA
VFHSSDLVPYARDRSQIAAWQAVEMSVVKINAIEVPAGAGPELEQRFAARAGMVDQQPGFEEFMLLRPTGGEQRYFVLTRWESEEAFQNWRTGQAFQHGHGQADQGGAGSAAERPPVSSGATLLEFEVVSRTPA